MSSSRVQALIEEAFRRLAERPGYNLRHDQLQLSLLIGDCLEGGHSGMFEAPTGLGKSLAGLIPAIAKAIVDHEKTVIATYTNVLAEQYWRKDLPLALSLFDEKPKTAFLIGRQRYACMQVLREIDYDLAESFKGIQPLGIESDFLSHYPGKKADAFAMWRSVAIPPVCAGRLCPSFSECFYFGGRRTAERAKVVITNHSVVFQDAILKSASEGTMGSLGKYDALIMDEAHDLFSAAINALEFELSEGRLGILSSLSFRMEKTLDATARKTRGVEAVKHLAADFRKELERANQNLRAYQQGLVNGILMASPLEVEKHPQVQSRVQASRLEIAEALADDTATAIQNFTKGLKGLLSSWSGAGLLEPDEADSATEALAGYTSYLSEFALGCLALFSRGDSGVTFVDSAEQGPRIRRDVVDVAPYLKELVWDKVPTIAMSATLSLAGSFQFFAESTGHEAQFKEILPSPFDFSTQAALYVPQEGRVFDPAEARKAGREELYWDSLAKELSEIITLMQGRTLVLCHSRREMEELAARVRVSPDLPILVQRGSSNASTGERFKRQKSSTLFALRSFWTGFDAPGETLSCVVLTRIPFAVPVEPPEVVRQVWLEMKGAKAFRDWTMPNAQMLVRQGVGRLIRNVDDKGLICLMDPRIRTKSYGAEFLECLPPEVRQFSDSADAIGYLGLG